MKQPLPIFRLLITMSASPMARAPTGQDIPTRLASVLPSDWLKYCYTLLIGHIPGEWWSPVRRTCRLTTPPPPGAPCSAPRRAAPRLCTRGTSWSTWETPPWPAHRQRTFPIFLVWRKCWLENRISLMFQASPLAWERQSNPRQRILERRALLAPLLPRLKMTSSLWISEQCVQIKCFLLQGLIYIEIV